MTSNLSFIIAGILAGIGAGVFGIGGGVILVPFMALVLGFSQHQAIGTSLVALLMPVGILGAYQYYLSGKITSDHIRSGLWISLGMFLGAYLGSKISIGLSPKILQRAFSVFMGMVALKMWFV